MTATPTEPDHTTEDTIMDTDIDTQGNLSTFDSYNPERVNVVGSDPLTGSTISMGLTLDRAEAFAHELLAAVAAKREG